MFSEYLATARREDQPGIKDLEKILEQYFHGQVDIQYVTDSFRIKLNKPAIGSNTFLLREENISPQIVDFMHDLHNYFVKVGILANLGSQEYKLLSDFNGRNQIFDVIAGPLPLKLASTLLSEEVFEAALQAIGEPARACLVVSSNQDYINFARSIGLGTLKYESFPQLKPALDQILTSEQQG